MLQTSVSKLFNKGSFCCLGGVIPVLALLPFIYNAIIQFFELLLIIILGTTLAIVIVFKVSQEAIKLYVNPDGTLIRSVVYVDDERTIASMRFLKRYRAKFRKVYHHVLRAVAEKLWYYYQTENIRVIHELAGVRDMQDKILILGETPEPKLQCGTYVCVSQNVDMLMNRIFEYTFRDYVETWYATVSSDRGMLHKLIKSDFWETYDIFSKRLAKVDTTNLVMNRYTKTLTQYFRDLDATDPVKKNYAPFHLHPCLRDSNSEKEFLRRVSEYIIRLSFPNHISSNSSSRVILREILSGLVFLPLIETVCDPDYINLCILSYFAQRQAAADEKSRTYMYAATYEDFIRIISTADSVSELRKIHRHIMTELMHATAVSSLKRDDKKVGKAKSMAKGELLLSRDLKKYINQCQVAKQQCEKRLRALGCDENQWFLGDRADAAIASSVRLLTYDEVMASHMARSYFLKYLKSIGKGPMLKFWCEIDIGLLKEPKPSGKEMAKIISHIYQTYIVSGSPDELDIEIDRLTLKGMESCVLGNKDTEEFINLQKCVSKTLEKEHFPSFVVSDFYIRQLMPQLSDAGDELADMLQEDTEDLNHQHPAAFGRRKSSPDEAVARLKEIEDRLEYKAQALESLRPAAKQDHKLTKVLEGEIEILQREKLEQQLFIERTEQWWAQMGSWNASIDKVSIPSDDVQSKYPIYSIVVVNAGASIYEATDDVSGWVIERNLQEFQQLHQELKKFQPSLKKRRLPTLPVISFGTLSDKFLDGSKNALNDYLKDILSDQILSRSELVYTFLTPSTARDKSDDAKRKKNVRKTGLSKVLSSNFLADGNQKISLLQLGGLILTLPRDILEAIMRQEGEFSDSDDDPDENLKDIDPDSIAAPMYELINEIFEIHGLFRALRKTLIIFVRLAFGGSINKQIRETVQWLVSEPMLTYYLQMFMDSMWPDGKLKPKFKERTEEEKGHTVLEAQVKFLDNIPEALQNLIGHENARRGFSKIFCALQDKRLNKHLFYKLIEETMEEVFPEILVTKD